jgi:hypothetical protein
MILTSGDALPGVFLQMNCTSNKCHEKMEDLLGSRTQERHGTR